LPPKTSSAATGALQSDDGSLVVHEVVVIHDAQMDDSDTGAKPRARLVFSDHADVCNALADGFTLRPGEKAISVWIDEASFTVGHATLSVGSNATGGASFLDETSLCGPNPPSDSTPGTGSLDVTSASDTVVGTVEVTAGTLHLAGKFTAKSCAAGRTSLGRAACPAAD
jgi:hypothetical protein